MADFKDKLKKRLGKVENDFPEDNITYDAAGNHRHVICWKCGAKIAGWVDADVKEIKKEGEQTIVTIRQKFGRYENFAKVKCTLSDGAVYEPVFCTTCAPKVTQDDVDKVYCRDLAKWGSASEKTFEHFNSKKVILKKEGE
jgi:hypothetical protein